MNVLHILAAGNTGGIEMLCNNYAAQSKNTNIFLFPWGTGDITEKMIQQGYNVICLHISKKRVLEPIKKIIEICIENKINVVVEHHSAPIACLYLLAIKKKMPEVKLINYAHCNANEMIRTGDKRRHFFYKPIIKYCLKRTDAIVAISDYVKQSLVGILGIDASKIKIIYNGVNVKKFNLTNIRNTHRPNNLVFVGRLIEGKGVQIILKAMSILDSDLQLSIVGDGAYKRVLENMTEKMKIKDSVTFWGNRDDVQKFLSDAAIFIHTPILEEGFGITIVEAMASGCICVCAKSGGIPEIVKDKCNGYLIEKENVEQLSKVLDEVVKNYNSPENVSIRENAIKTAKMFSIEEYSANLDSYINKIN